MKGHSNLPTKLHGIAHRLWRAGVPVLPFAIQQIMRVGLGCFIPYQCEISGRNVHFAHNGMGVCLDRKVRIGHDVRIHQHVTLGVRDDEDLSPVVGNHVLIGANAVILGGVHIGNHVKIGAGAVVLNDVPDGVTVAGVPARPIRTREIVTA